MHIFAHDPQVSILQPKIKSYKQRNYFEYAGAAGGYIDKYGFPYCRGRVFDTIEEDTGQYDEQTPIFWASGACFFIERPFLSILVVLMRIFCPSGGDRSLLACTK